MDIIGLLKGVLLALTAYLQLQSKTFFYDIITKSRDRQQQLIDEIEKLRAAQSNDSNDRADVLRSQLIGERKYLDDLSAAYTLSGKG